METIWQDLKYAVRTLRKSPGFTAAAILALALGIGANTAIFSVINAVLLNSRPLRALWEPDRLVMIWEKNPALPGFIAARVSVCLKNYFGWKEQTRSFEGMALYGVTNFTLTARADGGNLKPKLVSGAEASADFFPLLGIQPRMGRNFTVEEMQPGKGGVAIIGDNLYRGRFGGDPRMVGKRVLANGRDYEIVGVLPPGFNLPAMGEGFDQNYPEMWIPLSVGSGGQDQHQRSYYVFGRLKRGVTLEQARAEMNVVAERLLQSDPKLNTGFGANVFPLAVEDVSPTLRRSLMVLQAAVAFVLLIACANVANLLLTRAVGREREVAIRAALGASRLRMMRQTLTESLLLGGLGGAAGLLLAFWGLRLFSTVAPADTHGFHELRLDPLVLGFTILAAMLSGLLFGLAPALHAVRRSVNQALGHGVRSGGGASNRLRGALVVLEVALSLILLIGAGLMIRGLGSLMSVDSGFRPDHLLKMRIALPESKYSKERTAMFGDRLLEGVRALAGVQSATLANGVPMQQVAIGPYGLEGVPGKPNQEPLVGISAVREGYFDTLGIKLLRGGDFTRQDAMSSRRPAPVVVNEMFARQSWPKQEALGRIVLLPDGKGGHSRCSVIGIVASTRQMGPDSEIRAEIYLPDSEFRTPMLLVRTAGAPLAMLPAIEKQVWEIDKDQPVHDAGTMESVLRRWTSQRRFTMVVLAAFAGVALVLAGVGLYSVLAYSVSLRTREIGVRVALGADPRSVARLVVRQGLALTLIGVGVGLAGAFALTRLMASLVFGVSATDPYTFAAVALLLIAVAVAASYLPARRAARIDPMEALRAE
ncbi:MAG: ABC transporter permease [Bryobacterales bacterium]|nr:ABC transporter permease [Bryobacterales bacterium]